MVSGFVHETLPSRVVFGAGSLARVPGEAERLRCRRVLVFAGGSAAVAADRLLPALGARAVGHFDRVAQHVPEPLVSEAVSAAAGANADCLCSIGGGSATGLAKAVAVELDLPFIAVPTTYAGSEATPIYGVTGARKRTAVDRRALPRTVVYDPALTTGLTPHHLLPHTLARDDALAAEAAEALPPGHPRAGDAPGFGRCWPMPTWVGHPAWARARNDHRRQTRRCHELERHGSWHI